MNCSTSRRRFERSPRKAQDPAEKADETLVKPEIRVGQTHAEAIVVANKARRHCEQIATLESP